MTNDAKCSAEEKYKAAVRAAEADYEADLKSVWNVRCTPRAARMARDAAIFAANEAYAADLRAIRSAKGYT